MVNTFFYYGNLTIGKVSLYNQVARIQIKNYRHSSVKNMVPDFYSQKYNHKIFQY